MAIVVDKSGNSPLDVPYSSPNRKNAGTPLATLTPLYSGEVVQDTTTGAIWYATGLTSADWAVSSIAG